MENVNTETGPPGLDLLNRADLADAVAMLTRCCGAARWAHGMAGRRPFHDLESLLAAAETLWPALSNDDWREAFRHHPKIGDLKTLRSRFPDTQEWAAGEQGGAMAASEETLQALAEGNTAYEARFSRIFLVCATGKSAAEMLTLLQVRLSNTPQKELGIAVEEQKKITRLRLVKLAEGAGNTP